MAGDGGTKAVVAALRYAYTTDSGQLAIDKVLLRLPILGPLPMPLALLAASVLVSALLGWIRALQEREIRPLGSAKSKVVDVRVTELSDLEWRVLVAMKREFEPSATTT